MKTVDDIRAKIADLEKNLSLRQISIMSKINYITLRNIKVGTTQRVSSGILQRFSGWASTFDPAISKPVLKRPGRKPGAKAATTQIVKGTKKVVKKALPPVLVAPAPTISEAPAKRGRKPGRKSGRKPGMKPMTVTAPPKTTELNYLLGSELKTAIRETEARLVFLRSLEKAESEYRKMLGN